MNTSHCAYNGEHITLVLTLIDTKGYILCTKQRSFQSRMEEVGLVETFHGKSRSICSEVLEKTKKCTHLNWFCFKGC